MKWLDFHLTRVIVILSLLLLVGVKGIVAWLCYWSSSPITIIFIMITEICAKGGVIWVIIMRMKDEDFIIICIICKHNILLSTNHCHLEWLWLTLGRTGRWMEGWQEEDEDHNYDDVMMSFHVMMSFLVMISESSIRIIGWNSWGKKHLKNHEFCPVSLSIVTSQ